MATKTLMTVEEFVHLDVPENENFELVDGELVPLSSPTPLHSLIRDRLILIYLDSNPIGGAISEVACQVSDQTARKPDVSIFLGERWKTLDLRKVPVPFAPDIAVEVFSPSEHVVDVNRKPAIYLATGSQEVRLLDPDNAELTIPTETQHPPFAGQRYAGIAAPARLLRGAINPACRAVEPDLGRFALADDERCRLAC
jgi:Uma2 family endonuclease